MTRWAKFASQRGAGRRRRRRRQGHASPATARRPSASGSPTSSPSAASSSPFAEHGRRRGLRGVAAAQLHRRPRAEEAASALNLPPSPPCTDSEFIRRAYLDAAGILPTPEEVDEVPRRHGRRQAGEADRRAAGAAGVRRLLGLQVVGPAAGLDAASCRSRRCGRSTSSSARAWPTTSRGTASPATS